MMFHWHHFSFWAKRGIESVEESSDDQDQDLQGLPTGEEGPRRPSQASAASWSTLHNSPSIEEEGRQ